jgi:predicted ABC-type exoprotein transport system permease subunit
MLVKFIIVVVFLFVITLFGYSKWMRYAPTGNEEKETENTKEG